MTNKEIIDRTNSVFEEYFEIPEEDLKPKAHLFEDFGLDSLDILDLIVAFQQNFGVNMRNEDEIRSIQTLGDVYQFIINERDKLLEKGVKELPGAKEKTASDTPE
jgi:acyl carrier protein